MRRRHQLHRANRCLGMVSRFGAVLIAYWKPIMDRRSNQKQSEIVELGIFVCEYSSVRAAAFCMARAGVDIGIARRVLLTPARRRKGHSK